MKQTIRFRGLSLNKTNSRHSTANWHCAAMSNCTTARCVPIRSTAHCWQLAGRCNTVSWATMTRCLKPSPVR